MRRWLALSMIIMLALAGHVSAQEDTWSVWVYDASNARAAQINNAGIMISDESLPVPALFAPGTFTLSRGMAVSYDGTRLAYSVSGSATNGQSVTVLVVYDPVADAVLTAYQPPVKPGADVLDLLPHPNLFNLTGGAVAYSYASGGSVDSQKWTLVVIDILTGTVLSELNSSNPAIEMQNYEAQVAPMLIPAVMYYEGATINFSLVAFGSMAVGQEFDNFAWDVITGRVIRTSQFPNLAGDYLPRIGESIVPIIDDRVSAAEDYMPYANALHVYRMDMGARVPFYASNTLEILRADFVQHGERVVIQGESLQNMLPTWMLIERDGTARALPLINAVEGELLDIPDGFVYVSASSPPLVIRANTRSDPLEQNALWVAPADSQFVPVWAASPENGAVYTPWAQLAPPLFAAQAVIVPSDTSGGVSASDVSTVPTGRGVLTVNAVALITTTDGDRLNMRSSPGLGSEVVARVENGARVVILDGPVAGDGFTWWQVRLNTGLVGWVVESADGVKTLVPLG